MSSYVTMLGTHGTGVGLDVLHPSAYTKVFWDAYLAGTYSLSDFIDDTTGGAIETTSGTTITDKGGGLWSIDGLSSSIVLIGMCVRLTAVGTAVATTSLYEVVDSDGGHPIVNGTIIATGTGITTAGTVDAESGGVCQIDDGADFGDALDAVAADIDGTVNQIDVLCHQPSDIIIAADIDMSLFCGAVWTPIRFIPVNSSFVRDGSKCKLKASDSFTGNGILLFTATSGYVYWYDLILDGNGIVPYNVYNNIDGSIYIVFINCESKNALTGGVLNRSTMSIWGGSIHNNGTYGYKSAGANRGGTNIQYCHIYNNGSYGVYLYNSSFLDNCIITGNGIGIYLDSYAGFTKINACILNNNVNSDIKIHYRDNFNYNLYLSNSSFSNTNRAIDLTAWASYPEYTTLFHFILNCHFDLDDPDDLTGIAGVTIDNLLSSNCIDGDPKFNRIVEVTDLTCSDHVSTGGYTVGSATGSFTADMVGRELIITGDGTANHFVPGSYEITSYGDSNTITLATDPTDGTDETGGDAGYYDFRLQPDSPLWGAGVGGSTIGALDADDVPAYTSIVAPDTFNDVVGTATGGGGGGVSKSRIFGGL